MISKGFTSYRKVSITPLHDIFNKSFRKLFFPVLIRRKKENAIKTPRIYSACLFRSFQSRKPFKCSAPPNKYNWQTSMLHFDGFYASLSSTFWLRCSIKISFETLNTVSDLSMLVPVEKLLWPVLTSSNEILNFLSSNLKSKI